MRDMITDQTDKEAILNFHSAHFRWLLKYHFTVCKLQDNALIKRKIWNGIHNIFTMPYFQLK